jgi:hypothetical protein
MWIILWVVERERESLFFLLSFCRANKLTHTTNISNCTNVTTFSNFLFFCTYTIGSELDDGNLNCCDYFSCAQSETNVRRKEEKKKERCGWPDARKKIIVTNMYTRVVWPSITFKMSDDDWFPPVTYRFLFFIPPFFFLFLLANEESTIKLRDIIIKKKKEGQNRTEQKNCHWDRNRWF